MAETDNDQPLLLPIIDSHIHLWPQSEAASLAWNTPSNPLWGQFSVEQYKQATKTAPSLLGFIFVEADRRNDIAAAEAGDESGWEGPLEEVRWLRRVATGQPREGEGHTAEDAKLCLGIIPWAPIPSGKDVLEKYFARVEEEAGEAWPKVKGFRFLLQDKPNGTMLEDKFIEGIKYLGKRGFVFEVGVDQHSRGKKQLEELLEMVGRAHEGVPDDEKTTFILNHLLKPDLTIYNITSDPSFMAWRSAMFSLGKTSHTYMKLSGGFAEMTPALRDQDPSHIFQSTLSWLGIVLATFGPKRIMFASDWPVCTNGFADDDDDDDDGGEDDKEKKEIDDGDDKAEERKSKTRKQDAWPKWKDVVEKMCWMASLEDEDRAMIFGGTAKAAYGL